ncbi:MAG: substrate-binding domain-containing protein [Prevotella sp.]|nr:substrate-binding domain-containing protein [Prevotella sp.]
MKSKHLYYIIILLLLLTSCNDTPHYTIGVSQCSNDRWRQKVNHEILIGQYLYDDVEVRITNADNNDRRQVRQIDSLVREKVDLLVVAPSNIKTVTPAIDRAYKSGIPVIVYDRKTASHNYNAYIGSDNVEIGRIIGHFVCNSLEGKGNVVEITGLKGSSPVTERHRGFMEVMRSCPGIKLHTINGDWKSTTARRLMAAYLKSGKKTDYVFAHNDREAYGAYLAAKDAGMERNIKFVGIDGLPGPNEGIDYVRRGILEGSFIYPTKGEAIMSLAMKILNHRPHKRENLLQSTIVTKENAEVVTMQNQEIEEQSRNLDTIYHQIDTYIRKAQSQHTIIILSAVIILLLLTIIFVFYRYLNEKNRLSRKTQEMAEQRINFFTRASHELRTPLTLVADPIARALTMPQTKGELRQLLEMAHGNTRTLLRITGSLTEDEHIMDDLTDDNPEEVRRDNVCRQLMDNNDGERTSVLVVDDNNDIREYLRLILQADYQVILASDGKQALQLARENIPDLIVSDVMMPVMDGLELCRRIKDETVTAHIPVLLLTARSQESQRIEGYATGADAYLTKPFSEKLLKARISNLLQNRRQLQQLLTSSQKADETDRNKTSPLGSRDQEFINTLNQVLHNHLANPKLKVEDIGDEMGLSRVQLYRKVKALTGITPVELMRKTRLQEGYHLLKTTNRTIQEIAFSVGFATPSYFTTCFKQEFEMYPNDVRAE